jgi:small subunit ribosomal protein S20
MAHHKSAQKRIRQTAKKRLDNRYYGKTTRNAIRKLRSTSSKDEASTMLPSVVSMIDKLAKRNQIHKNKASNLKSSITKHVNAIGA